MLKACVTAMAVSALVSFPAAALADQQRQDDETRNRIQIVSMETTLREAVRSGGLTVAKQLSNELDVVRVETVFVGAPEVQGIRLKNQGMVFLVRVPSMNTNIMWAVRELRPRGPQGPRTSDRQGQAQAEVVAQTVKIPSPSDVMMDPMTAYREAVKEQLIDAMLDFGGNLRIAPTEYLTVAARRDTPPNQLDPSDYVRTLRLTVSGATLDEFHQKRLTPDAARKLVEVDEY